MESEKCISEAARILKDGGYITKHRDVMETPGDKDICQNGKF